VQKRRHEYFIHDRKCKLKDCGQWLIRELCLIWPSHCDECVLCLGEEAGTGR